LLSNLGFGKPGGVLLINSLALLNLASNSVADIIQQIYLYKLIQLFWDLQKKTKQNQNLNLLKVNF
jgi:hypothetical protein